MTELIKSAEKLYKYILDRHWDGSGLIGPDPGLRFNFRLWRFVKSYTPFIPYNDNYYFLQCQGYWVFDNALMYQILHDDKYLKIIKLTADRILSRQSEKGFWLYPMPEWKGRVATVEGNYGARALLKAHTLLKDEKYLEGALKWHKFLTTRAGFLKYRDSLAINYFAGINGRLVPNNATLALAFLAELFDVTGLQEHLVYSEEMIKFIGYTQKENGELPYAFATDEIPGREHFLCFQYNSFQLMDLASFYQSTKNSDVFRIMSKMADFLSGGVDIDGHCNYNCFKSKPVVPYYTGAIGAALCTAQKLGIADYSGLYEKAYRFLLSQQSKNGAFYYSKNNYGILKDRRSYPRYLVMILKHLLMKADDEENMTREH